jgi:transcriptional regulator with XRE-family HTH domain
MNLGLTQRAVAAALGISPSKLARWEHNEPPHPTIPGAAEWLSVLSLDLVLKTYPGGAPLRDSPHVRLVNRFLELIPPVVPRRLEAPIPIPRDLRAWDVLLMLGSARVGVAVETRLHDWQELLRREQQKARDTPVDYLFLVLANTHSNRRAVKEAGAALRSELPQDGRAIRAALRLARDPGASGLLFL